MMASYHHRFNVSMQKQIIPLISGATSSLGQRGVGQRILAQSTPRTLKRTMMKTIHSASRRRFQLKHLTPTTRFGCGVPDHTTIHRTSSFNHGSRMAFSSPSSLAYSSSLLPILRLAPQFLRESDPQNYDENTYQRNDILFDSHNGKPLSNKYDNDNTDKYVIEFCTDDADSYSVTWKDGVTSTYSKEWVHHVLVQQTQLKDEDDDDIQPYDVPVKRMFWSDMTESKVRSSDSGMTMSFDELIFDDNELSKGLKALYQYGILLVTDTPIDDTSPTDDDDDVATPAQAGVAAIASCFTGGKHKLSSTVELIKHYHENHASKNYKIQLAHGTDGPLRTLFGTVWSTSSSHQTDGASVADSAYGQGALPLHTDMCYYTTPPGLQIFTMIQPAVEGGESVYGDGFAAARHLQQHYPDEFQTLNETVRKYRSIDPATGWHLEAQGSVIQTNSQNGELQMIRHNDLDRLPDLPPPDMYDGGNIDEYYTKLQQAHSAWDTVLSKDEFRLVMALKPGDTVIVANQRCLHARHSFRTSNDLPRSVMGCYVSQDDLSSRFRMEGFYVP